MPCVGVRVPSGHKWWECGATCGSARECGTMRRHAWECGTMRLLVKPPGTLVKTSAAIGVTLRYENSWLIWVGEPFQITEKMLV